MSMKEKSHYVICTGGPYEKPDLYFITDESDYYAIGVNKHYFYGTLADAEKQAEEFVQKRIENEYLAQCGIISVHWWIEKYS